MKHRDWLSDSESEAWIGLIALSTILDAALDQQLQRDSGISHSTFGILTVLSMAPDRTRHMSDLAVLTSSSQSRLSHAISRLEQAGWVIRKRSADDRRQVDARLTDAGLEVVRAAAPKHVDWVRQLVFDRLDRPQVDQLADITRVLLESLATAGFLSPLFRD